MRDVFAEEGEWRVGDDDVRLFEKFDALRRAEVAIAFERTDADLLRVGDAVAVLVAGVFEPDGALAVVPGEEVALLVLVAGGYEPFQTKRLELLGEVVEEVGDARVVAVAEDRLAPEVFLVVAQLVLVSESCV